MKILFNCLNLKKGGAERVISTLANKFVENNDVSIITLMNLPDAYDLDKKIRRLKIDKNNSKYNGLNKIKAKLSFKRIKKLYHEIIKECPDIIISFLPEPSLRLMLIRKFSKKLKSIPVIISIRNDPNIEYKNPIIRTIMKKLYKNVDGMVFQTNDAKKYFDNIIDLKKSELIPNPIDKKFYIHSNSDKERQSRVVTFGRLENQKNQLLLIEAFSKIANKNPEYILEIYGDGNLKSTLQSKINDLDMTNKIFLKGQIDDVVSVLNDSKIFALSSNYEGMPNALMEAMAMGLPCISTDCPCGGPKELIENNENGILVPVGNIDILSSKLDSLMNDEIKRNTIGKNAQKVRIDFSVDLICKKWLYFIKRVCKK